MLTLVAGRWSRCGTRCCRSRCRELPDDLARLDRVLSDHVLLCPIAQAWEAGRAGAGAAVDRDGDVRAVDGRQAPHRLGVRDAGAGGVGLAASPPVLSDRDRSAGAGRVDGPQARPPARRRRWWQEITQDGDREGAARDAVPGAGGEDRLDGGGGRYPLSVRRGARLAGRQVAHARGPQAAEADRRHGRGCATVPARSARLSVRSQRHSRDAPARPRHR